MTLLENRPNVVQKIALAWLFFLIACHALRGEAAAFSKDELGGARASVVETAYGATSTADRILTYFPGDSADRSAASCLADSDGKLFLTRRFGLEGRCKSLDDESQLCAYRDYRKLDLGKIAGFDQRGVYSSQVTFPGAEHLYAALSLHNEPGSRFCWIGGAHVGQNPLAMTWSGDTGTKRRKNNFVLAESGLVQVEGARIHNLHDVFLASGPDAGFHVLDSWITWNRDDIFEGYLHDLQFTDTLVDGTYTFISDPDGECDDDKKASRRNIVIEDSLIRLQRQPGPFARHTDKWHWAVEGGHNTLWKLDSCDWDEWPTFTIKNNVFLIEGPRTTFKELNKVDCRLALPGDCADFSLGNLKECRNNLFLYTQYEHWRSAGAEPGPVPQPGNRFHNAGNPTYAPNGIDCYQRLTDDIPEPGSADVVAIWKKLRGQWIDRHTDPSMTETVLMKIPGVDFPIFETGSTIRIVNRASGDCLVSDSQGGVRLQACDGSVQQLFSVETFDDGKLSAAMLFTNAEGDYLASGSTGILESHNKNNNMVIKFGEEAVDSGPAFSVRWYVKPITENVGAKDFYSVESDALQRSFLRQDGKVARMQAVFEDGIRTALPQDRFIGGNDYNLQWELHEIK